MQQLKLEDEAKMKSADDGKKKEVTFGVINTI